MSVSQLCRVDAELLLETSREVTRNSKAHLGRHLTDGLVGLLQERLGFLHTHLSEHLGRSLAGKRLHLAVHLHLAKTQF